MADDSAEQGSIKRRRRTSVPCPKCGGQKSYNTSTHTDTKRVRRRRRCASCDERFSTCEVSAEDYKRLKGLYSLDAERARLKSLVDGEWAKIREGQAKNDALRDGFNLIWKYAEEEQAKAEADRKWQRENPTEAFKAIFPAPVWEYLNDWARRDGVPVIELMVRQIGLDIDIDIECRRDEGEYVEQWESKVRGHLGRREEVMPMPDELSYAGQKT